MNNSPFINEVSKCLDKVEHTGEPFRLQLPVYLVGNGGSAAVAAHICNDIVKNRGAAFVPDYATLSCLANDYDWSTAMATWLTQVQLSPSTVIAISSSGKSANIVNACYHARMKGRLITLTGFNPDNPVRKLGHTNYWVPSTNYGVVEICHLSILHSLINPG